jgi:hypothetical protein
MSVTIADPTKTAQKMRVEKNGGGAVNLQDQTTAPVELFFTQAIGAPTTLTAATVKGTTTILDVASVASISVGNYLGLFSSVSGENRFYFGEVLAVNALQVTVDTPTDFAFQIGDPVISQTRDLNVDGSGGTQIFGISPGAGTGLVIDITKIKFSMVTTNAPDFDKFGDIVVPVGFKGLVLRSNNGVMNNIWNIKNNAEFDNIMTEYLPLDTSKHGVNGISMTYTLTGQENHGVAVRLSGGESLQLLVQDALQTLLTLRAIGEGHVVEEL